MKEQQKYVDFDSFFPHTICHECCHGIGPHTITLPNGEKSTVRLELQELHSAMEEAKADIVGLWALRFLIGQGFCYFSTYRIRFPYPWQWGAPTVNAMDAFIMMAAAMIALAEIDLF
ncbi:hypothetical protein ACSBR2_002387 [Camellia fascicularis]